MQWDKPEKIETVPKEVRAIIGWDPKEKEWVTMMRDARSDEADWWGVEDYTPYHPSHWFPVPPDVDN